MSFSKNLKAELATKPEKTCCRFAETYGLLLGADSFSHENLSFVTECEDVITRLNENCKRLFKLNLNIKCAGNKKEIFTAFLPNHSADIIKEAFSGSEKTVIKEHNINDECCQAAFLRGMFLSCGYMDDPKKNYNLEFALSDLTLAFELNKFLNEKGLYCKLTSRKNYAIVYIKDSDILEDFLTTVGAADKTLELVNIKILKDMRNRENRTSNCTVANIEKTVNASVTQRRAIDALKKSGILDDLSIELRQAAKLRTENFDASISELAALSSEKISRSGLNHRLQKLINIAKENNLI